MVADALECKIAGVLKMKVNATDLDCSAVDVDMGAAKKIKNILDADAPA